MAAALDSEVFKAGNKSKHELFKRFISGEQQNFFAQRKIAQSSLNLQVADTLVLHDLHWSLDFLTQSEGRVKRLDSPYDTVYIIFPIIKNTIEERVMEVLKRKESERESILANSKGIEKHIVGAEINSNSKNEIRQILESEFFK
jgi:SNF2 family DNA or RNA helicase